MSTGYAQPQDFWTPETETKAKLYDTFEEWSVKKQCSLENNRMARANIEFYMCVNHFTRESPGIQQMKAQMGRRDIDIVCGIELRNMKRLLLKEDGLSYESFHENLNFNVTPPAKRF
jgi:hypothetical protein